MQVADGRELIGARPMRRLIGFAIDFVVQLVVYRAVILPLCGDDRVAAVGLWLVFAFTYFSVPVFVSGRTLGDFVCRMQVVSGGRGIGAVRALARKGVAVGVCLTLNTFPPIIGLAIVAVLGFGVWRSPGRRTILERASGTTVVGS